MASLHGARSQTQGFAHSRPAIYPTKLPPQPMPYISKHIISYPLSTSIGCYFTFLVHRPWLLKQPSVTSDWKTRSGKSETEQLVTTTNFKQMTTKQHCDCWGWEQGGWGVAFWQNSKLKFILFVMQETRRKQRKCAFL